MMESLRVSRRVSILETSFNRSGRLLETSIIEKNNDDYERKSRRSLVQLQNTVASPGNVDTPQRNLNMRELKSHLDICIKMNVENSISNKNAWKLKIIDYMQTIMQSSGMPRDTFQIASASLDASTKVYGIRVDDIYADGMQLASNMARAAQKNDKNDDNEDEEAAEGEGGDGKVKKKKKKTQRGSTTKSTVAKEAKTLLGNLPKMESGFFQTQTNSNSSLVDNLFSSKMLQSHCGCKFMLQSQEKFWCPSEASDVSRSKTTYNYELPALDQFGLCQDFANFEVDNWDPTKEDGMYSSSFNADELVLDDKGIPMAELDGSIQDIFEEDGRLEYVTSDEEEECPQIAVQGEIASISELSESLPTNDFLYNSFSTSKFMSQVWAGPSHWKLKHVRQAKSRFTGSVTEVAAQKRAKAVPQPIDFTKVDNILDKKYLVKKRVAHVTDESKFTLPRSYLPKDQTISLLLKPVAVKIMLKKEQQMEVEENDISTYNYENASDTNYCANNFEMDDDNGQMDDANDEMCTEEDVAVAAQMQQYVGENLIDLPNLVPKTQITYATAAKNMDMKKLKQATWKILTNKPNTKQKDSSFYGSEVPQTTFNDVYTKLPNRLNKKMQDELSCSLVFIAILHLANENNLKLTSQDDLRSFSIEKDVM